MNVNSAQILCSCQFGSFVGEAALQDTTIVPGSTAGGLSVLLPEGHELIGVSLDSEWIVRERVSDGNEGPGVLQQRLRHFESSIEYD